MRIALCISSLGRGGAEKIAGIMANHWAEQGHEVDILTLASPEVRPTYGLDQRVRVHNLDRSGQSRGPAAKVAANLARVRSLRRALRSLKPDAAISFMDATNVLVLLAARGLGLPVIATEHCHPEQFPAGWAWSWLRRRTYPRAAAIVVLGEEIRRWFAVHVRARRLEVIQNPVILPAGIEARAARPGRTVMAAGRLAEEKQFGLLIEAFAMICPDHPEWELTVYGEGPERANLEALVRAGGLADRVRLPGWVDDLHQRMAGADIFALSSRSEAFPGALCEAMACGLAVVSFDCPSGPGEIICHEKDGLLAPNGDVAALARGLERLMGDRELRESLGQRAMEVRERYSLEATMSKWDALLGHVLGTGSG